MRDYFQGVDFVVTWLDSNDPQWQASKAQYESGVGTDSRRERYRDWDFLRFWFRGVEKFAPWVRKVFLVTCGHKPQWLDLNHPRLRLIEHCQMMPKEYLPTFNSNAIELFLHKIPGISERFVYFNDDTLLIRKVKEKDFFYGGLPRDMMALQPIIANKKNTVMPYLYLNNSMVIAKHFDKRTCMKRYPWKFFNPGYPLQYFGYNLVETAFPQFTGFYSVHGPMPFRRGMYEQLWNSEEELLMETASHKFRDQRDVSIYLFREWQKLSGLFKPKNLHKDFKYYELQNENTELLETISRQKKKIVCINDSSATMNFPRVQREIKDALTSILPDKSKYEKD
jgi:hypothetical protein